jgi:eukaryotic-like serine/threonine-protein kinase
VDRRGICELFPQNHRAVKIIYRNSFEHRRPYEREFEGIKRYEPVSRTHESQVAVLHVGRHPQDEYYYYVMELADQAGPEIQNPTRCNSATARRESEMRSAKSGTGKPISRGRCLAN